MADVLTLTRQQYDMLLDAAYAGDTENIQSLQAEIDEANFITRYAIRVRWLNAGGKAIATPTAYTWPESQTGTLKLTRPITEADVVEYLSTRATNPVDVHVTADLKGYVGWHTLEDYDFDSNAT